MTIQFFESIVNQQPQSRTNQKMEKISIADAYLQQLLNDNSNATDILREKLKNDLLESIAQDKHDITRQLLDFQSKIFPNNSIVSNVQPIVSTEISNSYVQLEMNLADSVANQDFNDAEIPSVLKSVDDEHCLDAGKLRVFILNIICFGTDSKSNTEEICEKFRESFEHKFTAKDLEISDGKLPKWRKRIHDITSDMIKQGYIIRVKRGNFQFGTLSPTRRKK